MIAGSCLRVNLCVDHPAASDGGRVEVHCQSA